MEKGRLLKTQKHYAEQMAAYLPAIRQLLNITQKELAERVGLTRQTIICFENKQRPLPWQTYLALVLYFQQHGISREFVNRFELFDPIVITDELTESD